LDLEERSQTVEELLKLQQEEEEKANLVQSDTQANFKVYFGVKHFLVNLKLEPTQQHLANCLEFLKIEMLNFDLEFEMDRAANIVVNMAIHKFIV